MAILMDPATMKGKVELVDGAITLNGTNSFSIPKTALGAQNDYTIDFEVKRAPDATNAKNKETLKGTSSVHSMPVWVTLASRKPAKARIASGVGRYEW